MRVHVTFEPSAVADESSRSQALRQLTDSGLRDIDEARFRRFGVASGEIDAERLADVKRLAGIKAVEADRVATIAARR